MAWKYHLQRAVTGEWLDRDFQMKLTTPPQTVLSGPGQMTATCAPEPRLLTATDGLPIIDDWSTLVYAELDGAIRWGGILTKSSVSGDTCTMNFAGFTAYPKGIPMLETYPSGIGVNVDVFDIVRALWGHLQGQENGNLGVVIDTQKAGVTVGTNEQPWGIVWWELSDIGDTINSLSSSTPFEYLEEHVWDDTAPGGVAHYLHLGYPRIGARREDLRFAVNENITTLVEPERLSDDFANDVVGVGKGEGVTMVMTQVPQPDGRLRRVKILTNKAVGDPTILANLCRRLLSMSGVDWYIPGIVVSDHENAPLGSFRVGDDILLNGTIPYLGQFSLWHRITTISMDGTGFATLSLLPSVAVA